MVLSPNIKGAFYLLLAITSFVTGDAIIKFMAGGLNLGQILAIRGVFATLLLSAIITYQKQWHQIHFLLDRQVIWRTLCETFATLTFFLGLTHMPIGNVNAIMQVIPLMVTLGAALFLGEAVGVRRWLAIVIGLLGVLIIIRPGFEGFDMFSLYIIGTVFLVSIRDLLTRQFSPETPTMMVTLSTMIYTGLMGIVLIYPMGGIQSVQWIDWVLIAVSALTIIAAHFTIIISMRIGEMSAIAPIRYAMLPIALVFGYFMFDEIPDFWMLFGSAIVIMTGIYTFHRERILARHQTPETKA